MIRYCMKMKKNIYLEILSHQETNTNELHIEHFLQNGFFLEEKIHELTAKQKTNLSIDFVVKLVII